MLGQGKQVLGASASEAYSSKPSTPPMLTSENAKKLVSEEDPNALRKFKQSYTFLNLIDG